MGLHVGVGAGRVRSSLERRVRLEVRVGPVSDRPDGTLRQRARPAGSRTAVSAALIAGVVALSLTLPLMVQRARPILLALVGVVAIALVSIVRRRILRHQKEQPR